MGRMTLDEREISFSQSAQDRRDGVWHVWTNDPYWHRRLDRVGARLVSTDSDSRSYRVTQRQLLLRCVPVSRIRPRAIEYLRRRQ